MALALGVLSLLGGVAAEQARAATTVADYSTIVAATDGVLSHWKFDEVSGTTAADAIGGVSGTYAGVGGLGIGGVPGIAGSKAIAPLSSAVRLGSAYPFPGNAPYTLEAWVRPNGVASNNSWIIDRESRTPAASRSGYILGWQPAGGVNNLFCKRYSNATPDSVDAQFNGYDFPGRVWHHVVCSYDGAAIRLYIDGVLVGTAPSSRAILDTSADPMWVGSQTPGPAAQLDGRLDDLAIYGRALDAAEITRHYVAGQSYRDAVLGRGGVQSYYQLAGSGSTQPDLGAPNVGATASGATTTYQAAPLIADAGASLALRGTGRLDVPARQIAATGTTEFWFRPRALQDSWLWYTAAATTGDGGGPEQETGIRLTSAGRFELWSTGQTSSFLDLGGYSAGATRHVALTISGATWTVYLDGAQVYSAPLGAQSFASYLPRTIYGGLMDSLGVAAFDGELDEIAWYSSALSASVIASHDAIGRAPITTSAALIGASPASPTNQAAATISFSSPDASATFTCRLDGAAWTPCVSPATFSSLADGPHTVHVRAVTAQGNPGASVSRSWTVDTAAPDVSITSHPTSPTTHSSGTVSFSTTDLSASMSCRIDGAGWGACASPLALTALGDGTHTVEVRATDPAGNVSGVAHTSWVVDATAPAVVITGGPSDPDRLATAEFAFSSSDASATFECELDGGGWAACATGQQVSSLSEGAHEFAVRPSDPVGNVGAVQVFRWVVDTTAPSVAITHAPPDPTNAARSTVRFESDDPAATFACRQDGGAWAPCSSPVHTASLPDGTREFEVRAQDLAGNVGPPSGVAWTVDTQAPEVTIISGPADPTNERSATLGLVSSEPGVELECRLDGGAWRPCVSPAVYAELPDGRHVVDARGSDASGNTGTVASYQWTIDTGRPQTVLTNAPSGYVATSVVTFEFAADRPIARSDCRIDDEAWQACVSPLTVRLEDGIHTFAVRARTASGVVESDGPVRSFVVDTAAPQTQITAAPRDTVSHDTASFDFAANEPVGHYDCSFDDAPYTRCSPPLTIERVGQGRHSLAVRATDRARNRELRAVRAVWTVVGSPQKPGVTSVLNGASTRPTLRCGAAPLPGATAIVFQWLRDGRPISGATTPEYAPGPLDVSARLACQVRYAYDDGPDRVVVADPAITLGGAVLHGLAIRGASDERSPSLTFVVSRRTAVLVRVWCRRGSGACPAPLPAEERRYGRATRDAVAGRNLVLISRRVTVVPGGRSTIDLGRLRPQGLPPQVDPRDLYVSARLARIDGDGRIVALSGFISRRVAPAMRP